MLQLQAKKILQYTITFSAGVYEPAICPRGGQGLNPLLDWKETRDLEVGTLWVVMMMSTCPGVRHTTVIVNGKGNDSFYKDVAYLT